MASKTKEINALTHAIETKMARSGELAVKIVQMKNDLGDTAEALEEARANKQRKTRSSKRLTCKNSSLKFKGCLVPSAAVS